MSVSRRSFVKAGALLGTGLVIGFRLDASTAAPPASFSPNAFLSIGSDGSIVLMAKNPEIGQGVKTSLPQIIAEELEVPWTMVQVRQALLDEKYGDQGAGGSTSVKTNFTALRQAGASAREMLVEAAARRWNLPLNRCAAREARVYRSDTGASLTYAELAQDAARLNARTNPKLKDPKQFKVIGQPLTGVDVRAIVRGQAEFGIDARPAGALVACIERCPVFGGAIRSVDDSAALKVPGVVRVMRLDASPRPTRNGAGVAVLATSTWAAMQGRRALKVEWDTRGGETESTANLRAQFERNLANPAVVVRSDGDIAGAFAAPGVRAIEAAYEVPFLAHVPMEPMNYTAHVRADGADVWGPTQVPDDVQRATADLTGLPLDKVIVRMTRSGGGFGRRLVVDYACEAVLLSKASGQPVQVVWTREDDVRHDFYRPAGMYKLRAALDSQQRVTAWDVTGSTTPRRAFANPASPPFATEVFPDAFPAGLVPHLRVAYTPVVSKVPRGALRAPGHNATCWVDQSFLDEVAHAAHKDPVALRLELLGTGDRELPFRDHGGPMWSTARMRRVIELAAEKSGWRKPAAKGVSRGFACHFMFGAYVAEVVSLRMTGPNEFKVDEVLAVVDCGIVVNRSGARNQVEGGIMDGLSVALNQRIDIDGGRVVQANFNDYPVLRMHEAPRIVTHFVDSTAHPEGLGEMSTPPLAPALCNALFAATGQRIRQLPIRLG